MTSQAIRYTFAIQHGLSTLGVSLPYGSPFGSAHYTSRKTSSKSSESKEKPLISGEISGDLVAGTGFEPAAFGL